MNQPHPVRALTVAYNGRSNVLKSKVLVSNIHLPNQLPAQSDFTEFDAIWDTGATNTVITNKVVAACRLSPISAAVVHTASETTTSDVCIVDILLPSGVLIPFVKVTVGRPFDCDLLIGMDIIGLGDFAISNFQGQTCFSFRLPSCEKIDFVSKKSEPFVRDYPKVERNVPCPCGSGKKYKNCHGV